MCFVCINIRTPLVCPVSGSLKLESQMVVSIMRTSGGAARALTLCAVSPDTCALLIN